VISTDMRSDGDKSLVRSYTESCWTSQKHRRCNCKLPVLNRNQHLVCSSLPRNDRRQILTHYRIATPEPIATKFGTIYYVRERTP